MGTIGLFLVTVQFVQIKLSCPSRFGFQLLDFNASDEDKFQKCASFTQNLV